MASVESSQKHDRRMCEVSGESSPQAGPSAPGESPESPRSTFISRSLRRVRRRGEPGKCTAHQPRRSWLALPLLQCCLASHESRQEPRLTQPASAEARESPSPPLPAPVLAEPDLPAEAMTSTSAATVSSSLADPSTESSMHSESSRVSATPSLSTSSQSGRVEEEEALSGSEHNLDATGNLDLLFRFFRQSRISYLSTFPSNPENKAGEERRVCPHQSHPPRSSTELENYIHTQIDYVNCLVPGQLAITNCSFYWGKIDRYAAEQLLEGKPEGTFLLRDSAQEEHLFSVSFRRFKRSLHARIEQWRHRFSFDSHDPGVFCADSVIGLIEHYKEPSHCMFFEPMLTKPLNRNFVFSLQHLARVHICDRVTYETIGSLPIPNILKSYLKEYHYRTKVRTTHFDDTYRYCSSQCGHC